MKIVSILLLSISVLLSTAYSAPEVTATVNIDRLRGKVNTAILGSNVIGYLDGRRAGIFNEFGGGLWDPVAGQPDADYLALVQQAGVSVLRWPGGRWRKSMDWKQKMVGENRQPFGLPEFLRFCEAVGAEPVITLPAEHPAESDIQALLAYLNAPLVEQANTPEKKWAQLRKQDGRAAPWGVRWFEFGNEDFGYMAAETYIQRYTIARAQVKRFSSEAMLGAVLEDSDNVDSGWTYELLSALGEELDFGVIHPYMPKVEQNGADKLSLDGLVRASLYADANFQYRLDNYRDKAAEIGRLSPLPLAVTEYNAHFVQNEPVPLRHTLATALHNADFVRVMLDPKNNILFANYWQLANSYWGMLRGLPHLGEEIQLRPNYHIYRIYKTFLLDELVELDILSDAEAFGGLVDIGPRLESSGEGTFPPGRVPDEWATRIFLQGRQTQENGILSVEFDGKPETNYYHAHKAIKVQPNALYRISVKSRTIDLQAGKIGIAVSDSRGWNTTFYQPKNVHLTGDQPWQWLTVEFRTLSDTQKIRVMPRKFKASGNTIGIAEFGETKIERVPGVLPPAYIVTGLATRASDRSAFTIILINKDISKDKTAALSIPDGYLFRESEVLTGNTSTATEKPDFWLGSALVEHTQGSNIATVTLPAHSLTALEFAKLED